MKIYGNEFKEEAVTLSDKAGTVKAAEHKMAVRYAAYTLLFCLLFADFIQ